MHYLCGGKPGNPDGLLRICQTNENDSYGRTQYPHPPAADTRRGPRHGHRQRDRLLRQAHQQTAAFVLAGPLGRRDDLRLVRRAVPAGQHDPLGRMGRTHGRDRHRGEFLRGHSADRRHRPAGSLDREPPRSTQSRGDGPSAAQSPSDAHGRDDGAGHRHPTSPKASPPSLRRWTTWPSA